MLNKNFAEHGQYHMLYRKQLRLSTTDLNPKAMSKRWNSVSGQPMVHVPKADATTESYGHFAVTANPQLNVPQYPIPLLGDVFVKVRGGQRFTKLDLKSAYQQLSLDPAW